MLGSLFLLVPLSFLHTQQDLPSCEWCGANEAPRELSWHTTIPERTEPGTWITIGGRVYKPDGKTPAEGIVMYLYHTNASGIYEKKGDETGNGKRHGYLRGWLRTNKKGEYRFMTIKPASYPRSREPAHIHVTVMEPGREEYWLDSFVFSDDPLLTKAERAQFENRGGSGIVTLTRNDEGLLEGTRDIVLMK